MIQIGWGGGGDGGERDIMRGDRQTWGNTCNRQNAVANTGGSLMYKPMKRIKANIYAISSEPGKRHDVHAHWPEAVSDWLDPLAYIENLA